MLPRIKLLPLLASVAACSTPPAQPQRPQPPATSVAPAVEAPAAQAQPAVSTRLLVPCGATRCGADEACCWDPNKRSGSCVANQCPDSDMATATGDDVDIRCAGDCEAGSYCSTDLDLARLPMTYACRAPDKTTANVICRTVDDCPNIVLQPTGCVANEGLPQPLKTCSF